MLTLVLLTSRDKNTSNLIALSSISPLLLQYKAAPLMQRLHKYVLCTYRSPGYLAEI